MAHYGVLFTLVIFISSVTGHKFPLNDVFHLPKNVNVDEQNYLCSIINNHKNYKCCECTRDCMKYKTCCIDILWNAETPISSQEYLDLFINVVNQCKGITCEPVLPVVDKNVKNHTSEKIFLVATCLKNASHIEKEGCEHSTGTSYDSVIPVFGTDQYI